jgi:hypothetical protein
MKMKMTRACIRDQAVRVGRVGWIRQGQRLELSQVKFAEKTGVAFQR